MSRWNDRGDKLVIYIGEAKGGRPRDIYLDNAEQRRVLDFVKDQVKKHEYLGWKSDTRGKKASPDYCIGRYNKSMKKIGITKLKDGVTGHGLRAQYAENAALIAHMIPPTLGGTAGQMPRDELDIIRAQISELLGHSGIRITGSYYGSFGRAVTRDEADRCKKNVEIALSQLPTVALPDVPAARMKDAIQLVNEMAGIDVLMTHKQAQVLWIMHSKRHGSEWMKLQSGNAEILEAAAISIVKQLQKMNIDA